MRNEHLSYVSISNFKKQSGLCNGDIFLAKIDVETAPGKCILADTCECVFSYNVSFEQAEIAILWTYADAQLQRMGLLKGYNTQYHSFNCEENILFIDSGKLSILVEFLEKR